jgi:hypothetical protein
VKTKIKNKTKFLLSYSKFLQVTIKWLAHDSGVIQSRNSKLPLPLEKLLKKFLIVLTTRGNAEAIRWCKNLRGQVFQLLSRTSSDGAFSREVTLSKDLRFLWNIEKPSVPYIKLLLTILYSSRVLKTEAVASFATITGASKMKDCPFSRRDYKLFWSDLGYDPRHRPVKRIEFQAYHKTAKAGPNGHGLMQSLSDLYTIYLNSSFLLDRLRTLGGKKLSQYIDTILCYLGPLKEILPCEEGIMRKLYVFADREGKTREVAFFDYFSQTALRPLHLYLFDALKKINQDYTFDQTGFENTLTGTEMYYSIDLTAFTDRFPVEVNWKLLRAKIGSAKATAWLDIMTMPFQYDKKEISYQVGNPMGAYSSWNSTTLSHHFVVWKACKNIGIDWKTAPYAMLGDDLVIRHRKLALEYCRLIRLLGVTWSKEKTHVSPHFLEFAKRLRWCGSDITPFPLAAMWEERDSKTVGAVSVYMNASAKGWFSPNDGIKSWAEYFRLTGIRRSIRTRWVNRMEKIWLIITILQMNSDALELLPFVEQISPQVAARLQGEEGKEKIFNILLSCVMQTFADSASALTEPTIVKRPLGVYAENLCIAITGFEQSQDECDITSLPESIPHLFVWGLITEDYLKSMKRAYVIDTLYQGRWEPSFRNVLLPASDSAVYMKREQSTMLAQTPRILEKFENAIDQLKAYPQLI